MTDMTETPAFARRLRSTLLTGSVAILSIFSTPAFAQDTNAAPPASDDSASTSGEGQAIVITGSRIARRDYQADSPIVTVGSDSLQNSSTSAIEENLNKLPQFSSTLKTPTAGSGDIQPTATNTPGAATISLRGLGSNRNLVLIDGRRATPSNASMAVDINTIPSAAIDRVEIISGGASSTYGADAVAGVTNFIMKKNFQGLQLDGRIGASEWGDNTEYTVSGIMGTNFADDRGNISLAFETSNRNGAYDRDRPWYRQNWANPNTAGSAFFAPLPGYTVGYVNPVNPTVVNGIIQPTTPLGAVGYTIFANPDGRVFTGFDSLSTGGAGRTNLVDGYNYKQLANGQIAKNFTDAQVVFPLRRFNMYARGSYKINDWLSVFGEGLYSNTSSTTVQEPAPVVNGWSAMIPNDGRALPTELQTILNSRADPTAPWQVQWELPYDRSSHTEVDTYNITVGLDAKIPNTDWTAEVFGQQGKTSTNVLQTGFASLNRIRDVLSAPNWGAGLTITGNAQQGGFGASTGHCTSGINPFADPSTISADCLAMINANIKTHAVMQQTVWEGDAQGSVFNLPAGPLQLALGASYRRNQYSFENDTLVTQGESYNDQALGLYPSGNSSGTLEATEFYGEAAIPLLKDIPFIQKLDLTLGLRFSDYNTTGTSTTWKAEGNWKVNDWIRIRGGYNRAQRAPNIAELYLAPQQTFAVAAGGDVCSTANGLPWSANASAPGNSAANAANVQALCRTLMQRSGDPNADQRYYNGTQPSGFSFVFPTLQGNANLKPETADTWTAGVVLDSPFQSTMLRRLRLSVDWYSIKVADAIGAQSVDIAQRQCFDTAFNPTLSASSPYCAGINRNVDGTLGNVITTYFNNGRFKTQGIDAQLDWAFPAGPGTVSVNTVFNYLISLKSAELANLPYVEYAGTLGPTNNGLDGGAYRSKLLTTFGYAVGPVSASIQWKHLPGVLTETSATIPATTIRGAPSYDLFNLFGTVKVTRDTTFRFGVDNLFNKAPPLVGVDSAPTAGNLAGGAFNAQFYDVEGRRFYVGLTAKF